MIEYLDWKIVNVKKMICMILEYCSYIYQRYISIYMLKWYKLECYVKIEIILIIILNRKQFYKNDI
jgi:hypothetical protein